MNGSMWDYITKNNIHLIVIYLLVGIVIYWIVKRIIEKSSKKLNNRQKTTQRLVEQIFKYIIFILVLLAILNALGVNITSLLAGVGIASVVIGLALKDVMEDFLSGLSIVLEDKFSVGDYVKINNFEGTVVDLGLKSTKIKNYENTVKVINNRLISEVINYSKHMPKITIDVPIPYDVENKLADNVLENIMKRIEKEVEYIKSAPELFGLQKFEESSITYRIVVETEKDMQFKSKRIINRIIKEEYDKAGISIPFNIIEVKNG